MEILSFLVVFCSLSTLVEVVKSTTQVSIFNAIDNGSQDERQRER
jgi:hypothetical protein